MWALLQRCTAEQHAPNPLVQQKAPSSRALTTRLSLLFVCHAGRHKAFSSLGLSVASFQQAGTLMALSELALQYKAPLRAGDVFYITTAVAQVGIMNLTLHFLISNMQGAQLLSWQWALHK